MIKRAVRLASFVLLLGLIGCTTQPPFVNLSGVPPAITQGESVSPDATGGPGSSSGLWFYNFSSSCGGMFNPATIGPTNATTVQTIYNSTGAAIGPCTLTVRLITASGRSASSSANTTILAGPTVSWLLAGNAGTNPATDFLGTTDAQPLILKTNGTEALRIDTAQKVGIGTDNPQEKLHVVGNLRLDSDLICGSACIHSSDIADGEIGVADLADGAVNSSKILDLSVDTVDLADNSVTSSKIVDGSIGSGDVNSAQIQLRVSGSCSAGNAIRVINADGTVTCESVGGAASGWTDDGTVVRLTTSTDNVGIGTATPTEQLEITGNLRLPPSTATTGIIKSGADRFIHNFGMDNFFAGVNAGNLTMLSGSFGNVGVGARALSRMTQTCCNTAVGQDALFNNLWGGANTAVGNQALFNNTGGSVNTAVGESALYSNTTGDLNTAVGWGANVSLGNLQNATAIGANAVVDASNKVRIGDINVTVIEGQVPFTSVSDKTKKENFLSLNGKGVLQKLSLVPVHSWNFIGQDPTKFRHYGPNAQDFFAAFGHDGLGTIGSPTTLTSGDVDGILMVSIQALYQMSLEKDKQIEQQAQEIEALKASNVELRQRLEALEKLVQELKREMKK